MPQVSHQAQWVVKGTKVILKDTTLLSEDQWNTVFPLIQTTVPALPFLKLFPTLEIIFEGRSRACLQDTGYCSDNEFIKGIARIHVCFLNIQNMKEIPQILRHEFIHLVQYKKTNLASRLSKYLDLVNREEEKYKLLKKNDDLIHLRAQLTLITIDIPTEGLALYCESETQDDFIQAYTKAMKLAQELNKLFLQFITRLRNLKKNEPFKLSKKILEIFEKTCDDTVDFIGYHIILTIIEGWHKEYVKTGIPFDPLDFIDHLLQVNRRAFYILYEQKCEVLGIRPVFSFDSGKGIFDYKTLATVIDSFTTSKK